MQVSAIPLASTLAAWLGQRENLTLIFAAMGVATPLLIEAAKAYGRRRAAREAWCLTLETLAPRDAAMVGIATVFVPENVTLERISACRGTRVAPFQGQGYILTYPEAAAFRRQLQCVRGRRVQLWLEVSRPWFGRAARPSIRVTARCISASRSRVRSRLYAQPIAFAARRAANAT